MKALDTNVVVRLLINDDKDQVQKAKKILQECEDSGEVLFVSSAVVLEVIWVLSSLYKCSKEEIICSIENLMKLSVLKFQDNERLVNLCTIAKKVNADLADLFIGLTGRDYNCETTLTFDKKATKTELFSLI